MKLVVSRNVTQSPKITCLDGSIHRRFWPLLDQLFLLSLTAQTWSESNGQLQRKICHHCSDIIFNKDNSKMR